MSGIALEQVYELPLSHSTSCLYQHSKAQSFLFTVTSVES